MIELKNEFTKSGGRTFKKLYKQDCLAIYEVSVEQVDNTPPTKFYEVFAVLVRESDQYHKDAYEKYPFNEAFGSWAWCCTNPSCVAKVLAIHFPKHPLTKLMLKHVDGTYKRNGETIPHFNLTEDELISEIAGL
jgi:hypothetical protein